MPKHTLIDLGPFPVMLYRGETRVSGELYQVDETCLESLDRLEGVPELYIRSKIGVYKGEIVYGYILSIKYIHNHLGEQYPATHKIDSGYW